MQHTSSPKRILPPLLSASSSWQRKGHCQAPPRRQLLDGGFFYGVPGWTKQLRQMTVNYAMPSTDKKKAEGRFSVPFSFSVSKCKKCLQRKIHSQSCSDRVWCHFGAGLYQIRHIPPWFSLESVAWWSVCIPLEFLPYIYSALGHGRWFWCLLFISFLRPSSTLPLPLKRHCYTTDTSRKDHTTRSNSTK